MLASIVANKIVDHIEMGNMETQIYRASSSASSVQSDDTYLCPIEGQQSDSRLSIMDSVENVYAEVHWSEYILK